MRTTIAGLITILILASSCATQKRCATKWPPEQLPPDTLRIITTRDSIVYKTDTFEIEIPGETDTAYIELTAGDPDPLELPDTAYAKTSLAEAKAWVDPGPPAKLQLILLQPDTTITARLDSAIMEAHHWEQEYLKVTQTEIHTTFKPGLYHKITSTGFWALIAFFAALIFYIKLRR